MMIFHHRNNIRYLIEAHQLILTIMLEAQISDPADDINDLALALDSLESIIRRNFTTRN